MFVFEHMHGKNGTAKVTIFFLKIKSQIINIVRISIYIYINKFGINSYFNVCYLELIRPLEILLK